MMVPILICSIIALAVIFDRIYVLYFGSRTIRREIIKRMLALIEKNNRYEAEKLIRAEKSASSEFFLAIFKEVIPEERENTAENAGEMTLYNLKRRLSILGIIGSVVPLMGLLGTVLGMIKVFSRVAHTGTVADISILAGGIWEALLTTAAGMAVAIPVLLIHHYFSRTIQETAHLMQQDANLLITKLKNIEQAHGQI